MTSRRIAITGKSGETSIYQVPVAWAGRRWRTLTQAMQNTPKEHHQRLKAAAEQQLLASVLRTTPLGAEPIMPDGEPPNTRRMKERAREAERAPDPVLAGLAERCALGSGIAEYDLPDVDLDHLTRFNTVRRS